MKYLKTYWREFLIILLAILFVSNCTGKGNYRRKYEKQIQITESVSDSISKRYSESSKTIDSLNNEIKMLNQKIDSYENEIEIYKDQNDKLAKKPVVVRVKK